MSSKKESKSKSKDSSKNKDKKDSKSKSKDLKKSNSRNQDSPKEKPKKIEDAEKSFNSWVESFSDIPITLVKHGRGYLTLSFKDQEFDVEYENSYPEGKLIFKTESRKIEDWIDNVNLELDPDLTIEEALTYAISLRDDDNEGSDDFGTYDDFGELDGDHSHDGDGEGYNDISITNDEIELMKLKKVWKQKEEQVRLEYNKKKELERQKNSYKTKDEEKVSQIFTTNAAVGVLTNDLIYIMQNSKKLGFSAEAIDDNIYNWRVRISDFGKSDISRGLQQINEMFGYDFVELTVEFKIGLYPFYPPLIRVIRPRFHGYIMGRITSMDILKLEKWDPVKSMSNILEILRTRLQDGGKIDVEHEMNNLYLYPDGAYTKLEHLLLELELLSDTPPRVNTKYPGKVEKKVEEIEIKKEPETKKTDKDAKEAKVEAMRNVPPPTKTSGDGYWAKGTGYGYDSYDSSGNSNAWNIEAYIAAQKERDEQHEKVILEVRNFLEEKFDKLTDEGQQLQTLMLEESSLIPIMERFIDNDSLLDMGLHESLYISIFGVIKLFAANRHTRGLLGQLPGQKVSIIDLLQKLNRSANIFMKTVTKSGGSSSSEHTLVESIMKTSDLANSAVEEFKKDTEYTPLYMEGWENNKSERKKRRKKNESEDLNEEAEYLKIMKDLQFGYHDHKTPVYSYHYSNDMSSVYGNNKSRILRLAQETGALPNSLPLNSSSSVFVKLDSDRIDVISALITGPSGTPYSNGCFNFDIFFPQNYPDGPPYVWLMTTGGNSFRFNPNLYAEGKVCLSLLGTWSGNQGENWNKDTSTLLQVLVSIQSLIMVPDPYFNEPGYESDMHSEHGRQSNRQYTFNIREGCIRIAMIGQLKNPKNGYEEIIRNHFKLRKNAIFKELEIWKEEAEKYDKHHLGTLNTLIKELESEIKKLEKDNKK